MAVLTAPEPSPFPTVKSFPRWVRAPGTWPRTRADGRTRSQRYALASTWA
jgi:hypothetical protein